MTTPAPASLAAPLAAPLAASLMAAALALPGLGALPARGEGPPAGPTVSVKYLDYLDFEDDRRRVRIRAPALYALAPLGDADALEATVVRDSVSGASPLPIFPLPAVAGVPAGPSGLSVPVADRRHSVDLRGTHYFERASIGLSGSWSSEQDWVSRAVGVEGRLSSDDNNTTLALGAGLALDDIGSTLDPTVEERRRTTNVLVGVTQVLSPVDLVQVNLTMGRGHGFFADVYRAADTRPSSRRQWAGLVRYNHYVTAVGGALHLDYRTYRDDWGVRAHTLEAAWYQPLDGGWLLRPRVRYHSQDAARFYSDGPDDRPNLDEALSTDYRLAAFGALGAGLKVVKEVTDTLSVDAAFDWYGQRSGWHLTGGGTGSLAAFDAQVVTIGLSWTY